MSHHQFARNVTHASSLLFFLLISGMARAESPETRVSVQSHDVEIAASLLLPDLDVCQSCPLIVLVQGSGTSDRSNSWTDAWAKALVRNGVAVLHTDKRGSGESGGNWKTAPITLLADDVSAFVDRMAQHPRIASERIGIMGFSQGGDVVPVVAANNSKVDFVVSLSGSVVTLGEQIRDEVMIDAHATGLSKAQLEAVRLLNHAVMAYAASQADYSGVEKALARAEAAGLAGTKFVTNVPSSNGGWIWDWLKLVKDFDPLPWWKKARQPVLFIYGGSDDNVLVGKSVNIIRNELMVPERSINLMLFNENGHALFREDAVSLVAEFARHAGANN